MTDFDRLYARHQSALEDFWGRRGNDPRFVCDIWPFGHPARVFTNWESLLPAAELASAQFSIAPRQDRPPYSIRLIVRDAPGDPGPVPENLVQHIQYTGHADWLAMQIGAWGHCQVNLARGEALAVLTPPLARRPDLIARWLLLTILTNLFFANGLAMLHATGLVCDDRALLLMAPHNSGKSTTALNLVLSGRYKFVSDSQIYVSNGADGLQLLGFPVGRVKLREDMLPRFRALEPFLTPEPVGAETKHAVDLRRMSAALVQEEAFAPSAIDLCLLGRSDAARTSLTPATRGQVLDAVMLNSLYYAEADTWKRNFTLIEQLLGRARCHHLTAGTSVEDLLEALAQLA